jgi:hypothetical protein
MSAPPVFIQLQPAVHGDKWQGIAAIGPILINDSQPAFPLSRIRMQFRQAGKLGMTLDSEPGAGVYPIEISDDTTWLAHIPEVQPLPLGIGRWEWDMEFWAGDDAAPLTLYYGTLRVTNDQTKP